MWWHTAQNVKGKHLEVLFKNVDPKSGGAGFGKMSMTRCHTHCSSILPFPNPGLGPMLVRTRQCDLVEWVSHLESSLLSTKSWHERNMQSLLASQENALPCDWSSLIWFLQAFPSYTFKFLPKSVQHALYVDFWSRSCLSRSRKHDFCVSPQS